MEYLAAIPLKQWEESRAICETYSKHTNTHKNWKPMDKMEWRSQQTVFVLKCYKNDIFHLQFFILLLPSLKVNTNPPIHCLQLLQGRVREATGSEGKSQGVPRPGGIYSIIPPVNAGSALRPPPSWTCPGNLQREETRMHPNQVSEPGDPQSLPCTARLYPQFGSAVLHSGRAQPTMNPAFPLCDVSVEHSVHSLEKGSSTLSSQKMKVKIVA